MYLKTLTILMTCMAATLFAQDPEPMPPQQSIWHTLVMIGIAVAFFYILLLRPEQKKRKVLEDLRSSMQPGDSVIAMGILGTVLSVKEETVILKLYDGAKIEVLKGAITDVSKEPSGA